MRVRKLKKKAKAKPVSKRKKRLKTPLSKFDSYLYGCGTIRGWEF